MLFFTSWFFQSLDLPPFSGSSSAEVDLHSAAISTSGSLLSGYTNPNESSVHEKDKKKKRMIILEENFGLSLHHFLINFLFMIRISSTNGHHAGATCRVAA